MKSLMTRFVSRSEIKNGCKVQEEITVPQEESFQIYWKIPNLYLSLSLSCLIFRKSQRTGQKKRNVFDVFYTEFVTVLIKMIESI